MMEAGEHGPAPEARIPHWDWTCWASALLIALMLLVVLVCGGVFLYTLSHRHQVVSRRGEGHVICRLQDVGAQPSAFVR